jgi:hypothetical protein
VCNDERIRRACGVILWDLENGESVEHAWAKASAREPELSDEELKYAMAWACNARLARDALNIAPPGARLCDVLDMAGVPWRELNGVKP